MSDDIPRAGDPWDPEWEAQEEEDDLFSLPPRQEGEGRRRFFRRLLGRRGADDETAGDSSVGRVYDDLRPEDEPTSPAGAASPTSDDSAFDVWLEQEGEEDLDVAEEDRVADAPVDETAEIPAVGAVPAVDETAEIPIVEPELDRASTPPADEAEATATAEEEPEEETPGDVDATEALAGDAAPEVPAAWVGEEAPAPDGMASAASGEIEAGTVEDDTGELEAVVVGPGDDELAAPTWSVDELVWQGEDDPEPPEEEPAGTVEGETPDAGVPAVDDTDIEVDVDAEGGEFVAAAGAFGGGIFDDELEITEGTYFGTATREHRDLADAIAGTAGEDIEQVPVAATIPGLDTGVVGFEDVVAAEGGGAAPARARSDLGRRVLTGVLLAAVFIGSLAWRPALIALAIVVFVLTAGEFYGTLMRHRFHPMSLFGFLGMLGASLGAVRWGVIAIPVALAVAATLLLLFYAVVPGREEPLTGFSSTMLVLAWVGGLTAFAIPIIDSDRFRPLVLAIVALVVMMDIAQYFVGRSIGRRPLAPVLSPKKTIEGLVGGVVVALALGVLVGFVEPFDMTSGLALGIGVAIFSPIGDLAVSAVKRTLGIKDMGSILPGHGGLLDRIDGLIFVIPVAWATFVWAGLL